MRPFFFWVHKTLPLVYDDSLSYMELLSKVLYHLNQVTEKTNEISKIIAQLTEYFNSADFEQLVSDKLDEMAEDGTLDALINGEKMFVPNPGSRTLYKAETLEKIANWLYYMKNSYCCQLAGSRPVGSVIYTPVYNTDGKGWQSLVGKDSIYTNDFDADDTDSSGTPIVYMNCTGFLNMITRCRGFQDSPYYAAFTDPTTSTETLRSLCLENGGPFSHSWTFDFLNWLHSYNLYYIMEKSGCTPNPIFHDGEYDPKYETNLETGDILFSARSGNSYYMGVHHCMYYLKSLEDLNALGLSLGCSFRAMSYAGRDEYPNTGAHGYVVHCSTGLASEGYANDGADVIRIDTLEHVIARDVEEHPDASVVYYASKPYSNALNSSKARKAVSFTIDDPNQLMFGSRGANAFPTRNRYNVTEDRWYMNEIVTGNTIVSGTLVTGDTVTAVDLNTFDGGVVSWLATAVSGSKILHAPDSSAGTCLSFANSVLRGIQIVVTGSGVMYFRRKAISGTDGVWGDWKQVTVAVSNEIPEPED